MNSALDCVSSHQFFDSPDRRSSVAVPPCSGGRPHVHVHHCAGLPASLHIAGVQARRASRKAIDRCFSLRDYAPAPADPSSVEVSTSSSHCSDGDVSLLFATGESHKELVVPIQLMVPHVRAPLLRVNVGLFPMNSRPGLRQQSPVLRFTRSTFYGCSLAITGNRCARTGASNPNAPQGIHHEVAVHFTTETAIWGYRRLRFGSIWSK